ncbi:MAG: glycosyltransferase family 4 protein [Leptonema sp. (in: Bacteria)]|nr:glycosyltransferase family 4 protein [Leptonema sp. (in: bacteria)]
MIGWEYPPHITGGLAVASRGLARALGALGHTVHFVVPRVTGDEPQDANVTITGVNSKEIPLSAEELQQYLLKTIHLTQNSPYNSLDYIPTETVLTQQQSLIRQIESGLSIEAMHSLAELQGGYGNRLYSEIQAFAEFVAKIAEHLPIDLIHAHDWMTYPAGLYAAHVLKKPLIAHVHATEFDRSGDNPNQYVYDLEHHTYTNCAGIITVSNYTRSVLTSRYNIDFNKIYPVYNAAEFDIQFQADIKKPVKEKIVLFLGRITFQKGPDYFVRAAKRVIEEYQNVRFVMVGTGDMYFRMIEMAADLGIGKYFHYTGFLNRDDINRIFRMSSLYVLPSVSEPFGISVLEAMVAGVPVIVSKQSGVSEVIENCIKVNFWDVDEIADHILTLLQDDNLHQQLSQGGQSEVQYLSWNESAKKISEIYQTILN